MLPRGVYHNKCNDSKRNLREKNLIAKPKKKSPEKPSSRFI